MIKNHKTKETKGRTWDVRQPIKEVSRLDFVLLWCAWARPMACHGEVGQKKQGERGSCCCAAGSSGHGLLLGRAKRRGKQLDAGGLDLEAAVLGEEKID